MLFCSPFMILRATDPNNTQGFADGFFDVPSKWYQLYAFHIFDTLTNSCLPVAYFLLSNKSLECYQVAFSLWKKVIYKEFLGLRHTNAFSKSCFFKI